MAEDECAVYVVMEDEDWDNFAIRAVVSSLGKAKAVVPGGDGYEWKTAATFDDSCWTSGEEGCWKIERWTVDAPQSPDQR